MSLKISFCLVDNVKDTSPSLHKKSWLVFAENFKEPELRGQMLLSEYLDCKDDKKRKQLSDRQKDGRALFPGTFRRPDSKSSDNIKSRTCCVMDFDEGYYSVSKLAKKLKGYRCIIHTSYSHSEECQKTRVIIPFDRPVTNDIEGVCSRILDYFETLLGEHIDKKCWTVSQLYYTPACPKDAAKLYCYRRLKGEPIETASYKVDHSKVEAVSQSTGDRPGDDYNKRGDWKPLLEGLGWRHFKTSRSGDVYYSHPEKSEGISGVVFKDSNVFYVFSSNSAVSPFQSNKGYSLFTALTMIKYNGDAAAAAKQLKSEGDGADNSSSRATDEEAAKRGLNKFPDIEFPMDVLPKYFRNMVNSYASALQCPPSFIAITFLTILSAAAGNSVATRIKRKWELSPFLWVFIVGVSGDGKSHPVNVSLEPIHRLQAEESVRYELDTKKYQEDITSFNKAKDKSLDTPVEPQPMRHYYTSNFTVESLISIFKVNSLGVMMHVDELAGLIYSLNQYRGGKGSDVEQIISFFDGGPMKTDRKSTSTYCRESGGAIIGGIQPDRLSEVFSDKMHVNGMAYRFLPYILDILPPEFTEDDISDEVEREWRDLITWAYEIQADIDANSGCIIKNYFLVNDEGKALWKEFHDDMSKSRQFMPIRFQGYIPKLKTYCLKFMSILHLLRCYEKKKLSTTINRNTVNGAIKLSNYFAGQALKLTQGLAKVEANPYEAAILKALESLKSEVKKGKIRLSRVREKINENLPDSLELDPNDPRVGKWLRGMNVEVKTGSGNRQYVVWTDKTGV